MDGQWSTSGALHLWLDGKSRGQGIVWMMKTVEKMNCLAPPLKTNAIAKCSVHSTFDHPLPLQFPLLAGVCLLSAVFVLMVRCHGDEGGAANRSKHEGCCAAQLNDASVAFCCHCLCRPNFFWLAASFWQCNACSRLHQFWFCSLLATAVWWHVLAVWNNNVVGSWHVEAFLLQLDGLASSFAQAPTGTQSMNHGCEQMEWRMLVLCSTPPLNCGSWTTPVLQALFFAVSTILDVLHALSGVWTLVLCIWATWGAPGGLSSCLHHSCHHENPCPNSDCDWQQWSQSLWRLVLVVLLPLLECRET